MPLNVDKISTGSLSINGTEVIPSAPQLYKVYTALLTQSGGDNPQTISFGSVVQGVSYNVSLGPVSPGLDYDFSNVGGPVSPETWSFVATSSSEPISWNGAILDYNTGAPVVTVLENTIGAISFIYDGVGLYRITESLSFDVNKTALFLGPVKSGYLRNAQYGPGYWGVSTYNNSNLPADGAPGNLILSNTPIEIRVYN
jgi:hypothetical protein